jgi:hypothetical protein
MILSRSLQNDGSTFGPARVPVGESESISYCQQ